MELNPNISGVVSHLAEMGKIKLGEKTLKGNVKYLDYIKVKKNYIIDNNFASFPEVHDIYGTAEDKQKIKTLKIKFPFNDIDLILTSKHILRQNNMTIGKGDGTNYYLKDLKTEVWNSIPKPEKQLQDEYNGTDKWKMNMIFSCIIVGFERVGSVFLLRTTSYNCYTALRASLEKFRDWGKGQLIGIEFQLSVERARNSRGVHAQTFLDYLGSEIELAKKAAEIKKQFTEIEIGQSEYEKKLRDKISKEFDTDRFYDDEDADAEFSGNSSDEEIDLSKLETKEEKPIENTLEEVVRTTEPEPILDNLEMPDLEDYSIGDKAEEYRQEMITKIAKMKTDAIIRVNEADTIDKLKTLKTGIGYKDDFGIFKNEADRVIIDITELINNKIESLTPKKDILTAKLIELGLNRPELRAQFYKNYEGGIQYLSDLPLLIEKVNDYKVRKIKQLVSYKADVKSIPNALKEAQTNKTEAEYEYLNNEWIALAKEANADNFKGIWDLYLIVTDQYETTDK